MAFPCIGMLPQSSARGLREARDLSTVVSAAMTGAASPGLRWANLDWDQAVPICRFGGGWNSQGACYQFYNIYIYTYIYIHTRMEGGSVFFWPPPLSRPKKKNILFILTDALAKDNDLNVYLSCADGMRKFDKDGKLLFLDVDRGAQG